MVPIRKMLVSANKYSIKCPYSMTPEGITIHNTANKASADNEIKYMIGNDKEVSYHYAIDDVEIVQGVLENRNAWHAGDGGKGNGNRKTIGIEICYSTGDKAKFEKAQENAAEFVAFKLKEYGWGIDKVYTHKHWSGKHCPHRTLDEYGWEYFLGLVEKYMGKQTAPTAKEMYRVRKTWADAKSQIGAYTNLDNAKKACKEGYTVFDSKGNAVYSNIAVKPVEPPKPVLKSVDVIAAEVMAGKWGNGEARKQALIKAGYDYAAVQAAVNKLAKGETKPVPKPEPPKPTKKSNAEIAKEVMAGKWGNGEDRKKRLQAAGYDYSAIQAEVNKLASGGSKGYKVQVTASALNVRAGAGTNYKVVKVVRKGQTLTIIAEKSGWGQLSDKSGWVSLNYTKKV